MSLAISWREIMDDTRLKKQIGANIGSYRKRMGMTQVGLAERLNYSDKAVSKWERGESVPDVVTLIQLAELFDVTVNDNLYGHFELPIYGHHQLMDALAVISVCYYENIESEEVNKYFKDFHGAKRRFTETFVGNNIIIDDYAHHPNEIKSTINAIKQKYPDKLIVSIFQPHTFTRTKEFASVLAEELSKTDYAYILDIHPAREKQEDYPNITKDIIISKKDNIYPLTINDASILNDHKDAVFIFMSPNDISKLEQDLINLKQNL